MPVGVRNVLANLIVAGLVYLVALWDIRAALALAVYIILSMRDLLERRITGED
jgi:hypothetical protein